MLVFQIDYLELSRMDEKVGSKFVYDDAVARGSSTAPAETGQVGNRWDGDGVVRGKYD